MSFSVVLFLPSEASSALEMSLRHEATLLGAVINIDSGLEFNDLAWPPSVPASRAGDCSFPPNT